MANNVRVFGSSPRLFIDSATAAYPSGAVVYDAGKFGVVVETCKTGGQTTLIERCSVVIPVPASTAVGDKLYAIGTINTNGTLVVMPPTRSGTNSAAAGAQTISDNNANTGPTTTSYTFVGVSRTAASNTLIGTAMTALNAPGLPTGCAVVELLAQ